jgi:predicted DCC family thiol-disulfide oxidoreductase YuxK
LGIQAANLQSIILVDRDVFFVRSNAVLEITRKLHGAWPLLYAFKIVPRFIRDIVYNWIARNRYRFFGKKDACWIPTPELKARFID